MNQDRKGIPQGQELPRESYAAGRRNGKARGAMGERLGVISEWTVVLVAMDHEEQKQKVG